MTMYQDPKGKNEDSICYFHRQPKNEEEENLAIEAISVSCVGSLRYGGKNKNIINKLNKLGLLEQCEHPEII